MTEQSGIEQISAQELHRHPDAVVIDVREREEFAGGRVPGAVNAPLSELAANWTALPEAETLYLICRSGARSQQAALFLEAQGRHAVNIADGTLAWAQAGYELELDAEQ